jgi:transketolase
MLERREKAHFMRIQEDEWAVCRHQLVHNHDSEVAR